MNTNGTIIWWIRKQIVSQTKKTQSSKTRDLIEDVEDEKEKSLATSRYTYVYMCLHVSLLVRLFSRSFGSASATCFVAA